MAGVATGAVATGVVWVGGAATVTGGRVTVAVVSGTGVVVAGVDAGDDVAADAVSVGALVPLIAPKDAWLSRSTELAETASTVKLVIGL